MLGDLAFPGHRRGDLGVSQSCQPSTGYLVTFIELMPWNQDQNFGFEFSMFVKNHMRKRPLHQQFAAFGGNAPTSTSSSSFNRAEIGTRPASSYAI